MFRAVPVATCAAAQRDRQVRLGVALRGQGLLLCIVLQSFRSKRMLSCNLT